MIHDTNRILNATYHGSRTETRSAPMPWLPATNPPTEPFQRTELLHATRRKPATIVLGAFVFMSALLLSSETKAGGSVDFTIVNGAPDSLVIEFKTAQNCLEPAVMPGFIGSSLTLNSGESWTKKINRRDGHGCDGENAVFWGRPVYKGKAYSFTGFGLTGDAEMWASERASDYPSLFAGGKPGTFTWRVSDPTASNEPTDSEKISLLQRYAPEIWLDKGESYFPSSVEWAFPFLSREQRDGKFWLYAKQELSDPGDGSLPVFRGNLESAPVYAFWVSGKAGGVIDLVYFTYYPYNRGKKLLDTVWGNHVGDWENMVVRLDSSLRPTEVFMSQHAGDQMVPWTKVELNSSGHPVAYSAQGSHGLYPGAGNHEYKSTAAGALVDVTSKGTPWNTWERLEAFDFTSKRGLGNSNWPRWMDSDYIVGKTTNPGSTDPASGAIFRWGNGQNGCGGALKLYKAATGECRLNDGPTGPIDKGDRWDKNADCSRVNTPLWRSECQGS